MARKRYQTGYVYRRGDVWYGRWWEDVLTDSGRVRKNACERLGTLKEYPTKRLAKRALEPILTRVNSPLYRGVQSMTFARFSTSWETRVLPTLGDPSTLINYRSIIHKHLLPHFGETPLSQVTPEAVQDFVTRLDVAPKTVRNISMVLRSMWQTAKAWSHVQHDPFDGLRLPKIPKGNRPSFSLDQIKRILSAGEFCPWPSPNPRHRNGVIAVEPYRTFYWIAAETGMRAGEVCGLRWRDIDAEARTIFVQQSVWRGKAKDPKSRASIRTFAISAQLAEHLHSLFANRESRTDFVFTTSKGTPWSADLVLKRKFKPLLQALGIEVPKGSGLHVFRHAQATLLDQMNVPMKVRQQRLGHENAEVTLGIYTHAVGDDERKFAAHLGTEFAVHSARDLNAIERKEEKGLDATNAEALVAA